MKPIEYYMKKYATIVELYANNPILVAEAIYYIEKYKLI